MQVDRLLFASKTSLAETRSNNSSKYVVPTLNELKVE